MFLPLDLAQAFASLFQARPDGSSQDAPTPLAERWSLALLEATAPLPLTPGEIGVEDEPAIEVPAVEEPLDIVPVLGLPSVPLPVEVPPAPAPALQQISNPVRTRVEPVLSVPVPADAEIVEGAPPPAETEDAPRHPDALRITRNSAALPAPVRLAPPDPFTALADDRVPLPTAVPREGRAARAVTRMTTPVLPPDEHTPEASTPSPAPSRDTAWTAPTPASAIRSTPAPVRPHPAPFARDTVARNPVPEARPAAPPEILRLEVARTVVDALVLSVSETTSVPASASAPAPGSAPVSAPEATTVTLDLPTPRPSFELGSEIVPVAREAKPSPSLAPATEPREVPFRMAVAPLPEQPALRTTPEPQPERLPEQPALRATSEPLPEPVPEAPAEPTAEVGPERQPVPADDQRAFTRQRLPQDPEPLRRELRRLFVTEERPAHVEARAERTAGKSENSEAVVASAPTRVAPRLPVAPTPVVALPELAPPGPRPPTAPPAVTRPVRPPDWIETVISHARAGRGGTVELRFALEPADLGQVRVHIESTHEQVRIRLIASSAAAVHELGPRIPELVAQLRDAGMQTDVRLDIHGNGSPEPQDQAGGQKRPGARGRRDGAEAVIEHDATPRPSLGAGRLDRVA